MDMTKPVENGFFPLLVPSLAVLCTGDVSVEGATGANARKLFLDSLPSVVMSVVAFFAEIVHIVWIIVFVVSFTSCVVY